MHAEENERLTRVGPGTPAGNWLRRYWHPIAISDQWKGIKTLWQHDDQFTFQGQTGSVAEFGERLGTFKGHPTPVRILGEDLVLFRDGSGRLGLIGRHCPHRGASFEYGRIRPDGIECCYHGWRFDVLGQCLLKPTEPTDSQTRESSRHVAYPVQELGGLIWAYMGPGEPPILPMLDVLAREDGVRAVENFGLWPGNYLQILENSPDIFHTGILHGGTGGERSDIWSEIPQVSWNEDEYGIQCRQRRTNYDRYSHIIFPTTNRLPQPWPGGKFKWPRGSAIFRTPVDDTHTLLFSAVFTPHKDGRPPDLPEGLTFDITEQLHVHRRQDYEAIISQGEIHVRSRENLSASDRGVVLLRRMIRDGINAVERGDDPKMVWRTPDKAAMLDFEATVTDDLLVGVSLIAR